MWSLVPTDPRPYFWYSACEDPIGLREEVTCRTDSITGLRLACGKADTRVCPGDALHIGITRVQLKCTLHYDDVSHELHDTIRTRGLPCDL